MSQSLFPVVQVPKFTLENTGYDTKYRRSARWDPVAGDFVRDGANRVAGCDGREAYAVWCFKAAQTERYRCLAYPDSIGVEMERALDNDDEKTVESMVQRTITDAVMVNPRTEDVWDFNFFWEGDRMHCSFKVKGVDWNEGEKTFALFFTPVWAEELLLCARRIADNDIPISDCI